MLFLLIECRPGSQRDSCRYNASQKKDYCEFLLNSAFLLNGNVNQSNVSRAELAKNAALLECFKYFKAIGDCKEEEKQFIPSIYG